MIKKLTLARRFIAAGVLSAFMFIGIASVNAQLADGLVAHWPLDELNGDTTPDLVSGYDMTADNLSADNVVEGKYGNAISFANADQTLLWRKNEEGDDLPVNKHDSFTVSLWSKVDGNGQNDLRLFSESNTQGNNSPLFNIGTRNNGADGTVDIFIRGAGPTVNHLHSTAEPFDGEWHHVVFVQDELERRIYVDGELDDLEIPAKPESGWDNIDATTIGGILRGSAGYWVTGLIDDVGIWKRALSADEVSELNASGIPQGGGELVPGLIAYWPFDNADEIEGSQVVVDLIGGLEGEVNGDGIVAGEGFLGGAIDFAEDATDGSVTIEYVNDWLAAASDADQLSVSLWQKLHVVRSTSTFWFSAESAGGVMRNYQAHIPWGNSNIYFDTAGCCGGGDTRISKAGGIDFLEWHNYVFIKDGENKSIYIDGELFHEGVNTSPLFDDWGTTYLGVADSRCCGKSTGRSRG